MGQVHEKMLAAFREGRDATSGAHRVRHADGVSTYRLHATDIVRYAAGRWQITNGGWDTPTTRAALSAFGFDPADAGPEPVNVAPPGWVTEGR